MKYTLRGVFYLVAILVSLGWGSALSYAGFVHPGLLNNRAEYDLIRAKVAAKAEPWSSAYKQIPDYRSYTPKPVADFYVTSSDMADADQHLQPDAMAAYASALHWIVTRNTQHAEKAKQLLNAWSYTLKSVGGDSSKRLQISWKWYPFMLAAEILKHDYNNWSTADQGQFEKTLRTHIIPNLVQTDLSCGSRGCTTTGNWAHYGAMTRMAIGIYLNDQALFDQALNDTKKNINWYIGTHGNPVPPGFTQETCRGGNGGGTLKGGDVAHMQMGLTGLVQIAEMAKKQGVNLYGHIDSSDNAGILTAAVYHAPFIMYPYRKGSSDATWPCDLAVDEQYDTSVRMAWQIAYNHYRHSALKAVVDGQGPAGNTSRYGIQYDKLTHNYGSTGSSPPPSVAIKAPVNVRVVSTQ
jgi:Alginate lyase